MAPWELFRFKTGGTIGGNIMNASPAGDTLPVLLAYGADIIVQNLSKKRTIRIEDFFTDYRETALTPDELLVAVIIEKPEAKEISSFFKVGTAQSSRDFKSFNVCEMHGFTRWYF